MRRKLRRFLLGGLLVALAARSLRAAPAEHGGKTALDIARENANPELIELLTKR